MWWRVWVLWPHSVLVRGACLLLLWATFCTSLLSFETVTSSLANAQRRALSMTRAAAASLFDISDSCPAAVFSDLRESNLGSVPSGALFEDDLWGLSASLPPLSLSSFFPIITII